MPLIGAYCLDRQTDAFQTVAYPVGLWSKGHKCSWDFRTVKIRFQESVSGGFAAVNIQANFMKSLLSE